MSTKLTTGRYWTTTQAAAELKRPASSIRRHCRKHGVGMLVGRDYLLTREDIERIKGLFHDKAGRPKQAKESPKKIRK